jgi:hypothetical protein
MSTKVTLTHKSMCLNYEFDVQIGELKATLVAGVWVYPKKEGGGNKYECEFQDVNTIPYMDIEIKGYDDWCKFRKFHKEMGIDFDIALNNEFNKVMTDEKLSQLVKNIKF